MASPFVFKNIISPPQRWKNRYSFLFDGVDEDILLGNNSSLNFTGSFTLLAWIYLTDLSHVNVVVFRSTSSPFTGYSFEVLTTGKLQTLIDGGAGGNGITVSSTVLVINTMYFVACTKTAGTAPKIYVNGNETAYDATSAANPTTNTANARIGGTGSITGWTSRQFEGNIDEVNFFNTNLSATQILELYNGGKPNNVLKHSTINNLVSSFRMGDGDAFDGTNWILYDKKGTNNGTSANMEANDLSILVP